MVLLCWICFNHSVCYSFRWVFYGVVVTIERRERKKERKKKVGERSQDDTIFPFSPSSSPPPSLSNPPSFPSFPSFSSPLSFPLFSLFPLFLVSFLQCFRFSSWRIRKKNMSLSSFDKAKRDVVKNQLRLEKGGFLPITYSTRRVNESLLSCF